MKKPKTSLAQTNEEIYLKKEKKHKILIIFARILLLIMFLLLWQIAADLELIDDFIFSSPKRILLCFIKLSNDKILFSHIGITVFETLISFFSVIIIGMLIAIIMWLFKPFTEIIEPYLVALNSLPKSALAPILIVWLGNNMKTIIVCAISVAIFGTILTLYTGFTKTDPEKIKLIKTLGGNKWDVLFYVLIPANTALIISTMKVNLGLSLVGVIIGEFLAAKKGLGYLIIYGSQIFKMDWVLLSIVILCLVAMLLYGIINLFEKNKEK